MANSNDIATRTEIFAWIKKYQDHIYQRRDPVNPVGVYFSPASRDFDINDFLPSYRGVILLLLQAHRELQVVTPRTLAAFHGPALVLPNVRQLNDAEKAALSKYRAGGGKVVLTGNNPLADTNIPASSVFAHCPGAEFLAALQHDVHSHLTQNTRAFLAALSDANPPTESITIDAPPLVVAHAASIAGTGHFYFANFEGLVPRKVAVPEAQLNLHIHVPADFGSVLHFVPFLGSESTIAGARHGSQIEFDIRKLERGAIAWISKPD